VLSELGVRHSCIGNGVRAPEAAELFSRARSTRSRIGEEASPGSVERSSANVTAGASM
jgi:hypothetical protein